LVIARRNFLARIAASLKTRLAVAGLLLVAMSAAGTAWLVVQSMSQRTERAALEHALENVHRQARAITTRLLKLQESLQSLAERLPPAQLDPAPPAPVSRALETQAILGSLFSNLFVAGPDGKPYAFAGEPSAEKILRHPRTVELLAQVARARAPAISQPIRYDANRGPVVIFGVPLAGEGGRAPGVLGGSVALDAPALMREWIEEDSESESLSVVLDASGRIVAHPDVRLVMQLAASESRLTEAVAEWEAAGRPVEPSGIARHVGPQIVSHAGIPLIDWVVMRISDAEYALGGPTAARRQALTLAGAVALIAGALLLSATIVLLRPLSRLKRRVRRMREEGEDDEDGWPAAWGELGELSAALREAMRERRRMGEEKAVLLKRMHAVFANVPLGIALTQDGRFVLSSEHLQQTLGCSAEALEGRDTGLLFADEEAHRQLLARIRDAFAAGRPLDEEVELLRRNRTTFWARLRGVRVDKENADAGAIWTIEDVSEMRAERETLSWQSTHDGLTGLANRREFERLLGEVVGNRRREAICALFIDLDFFKEVNDQGGHAAGDRMLVIVAENLRAQVRTSDVVARLGGDEFALLLRSCDLKSGLRIAEKILAAIRDIRLLWDGREFSVGASIGVVEVDASLPTLPEVLAAADGACYAAKRSGRNQVCAAEAQ